MSVQFCAVTTKDECKQISEFFTEIFSVTAKKYRKDDSYISTCFKMKFFNFNKLYSFISAGYTINTLKVNGTIVSASITNYITGDMSFFAVKPLKNSADIGKAMLEALAIKCSINSQVSKFSIIALDIFVSDYMRFGFVRRGDTKTKGNITFVPMEYAFTQSSLEK